MHVPYFLAWLLAVSIGRVCNRVTLQESSWETGYYHPITTSAWLGNFMADSPAIIKKKTKKKNYRFKNIKMTFEITIKPDSGLWIPFPFIFFLPMPHNKKKKNCIHFSRYLWCTWVILYILFTLFLADYRYWSFVLWEGRVLTPWATRTELNDVEFQSAQKKIKIADQVSPDIRWVYQMELLVLFVHEAGE